MRYKHKEQKDHMNPEESTVKTGESQKGPKIKHLRKTALTLHTQKSDGEPVSNTPF